MVFVCPSKEHTEVKRADMCEEGDNLKKENDNSQACTCVDCPCPCSPAKSQPEPIEPPNVLVCIKTPKGGKSSGKTTGKSAKNANNKTKTHYTASGLKLKPAKSRELRAGIMYVGCDCEKRNGLQDDCPRAECHGSPECLTKPNPICGPSEFCNAKHLEKRFGKRKLRTSGTAYDTDVGGNGGGSNDGNGSPDGDADGCYEYACIPACIDPSDGNVICVKF